MIGEKIKARRKELGMTVNELAAKIGVPPFTVYRWEDGSMVPRPASIERIAAALNCSVEVILKPL